VLLNPNQTRFKTVSEEIAARWMEYRTPWASLLRDLQMANYGHGKKNLYYNIPMFSCLFGSSALLATHADPGEEFVPAKPKG
jgi:hypothetical protein